MTELLFDKVEMLGDVDCSRSDFVEACNILNNSEIDVSTTIDDILISESAENTHLRKILKIARRRATANDIPLGTPTTSAEILRSLENGIHFQTRGVAQIVRQKIDGVILSASGNKLLSAINTVQKGKKRSDMLSIDLVLLLGKIQLQEYRMTDLAHYSGTCTAAITGVGDRLEKLGYVVREHGMEDRREVFMRLTEKGRIFLHAIETELTK